MQDAWFRLVSKPISAVPCFGVLPGRLKSREDHKGTTNVNPESAMSATAAQPRTTPCLLSNRSTVRLHGIRAGRVRPRTPHTTEC
jgi:hypothetical protein